MHDGEKRLKAYLENLQSGKLSNCVCNPGEGFVHQRPIPVLISDILWAGIREETRGDGAAASQHSSSLVWHSVFRREQLRCGGGSVDLQIGVETDEVLHQSIHVWWACMHQ